MGCCSDKNIETLDNQTKQSINIENIKTNHNNNIYRINPKNINNEIIDKTNSHNKNENNIEKNDDITIVNNDSNNNRTNHHQINDESDKNKTNKLVLNSISKNSIDNTFYQGNDIGNIIGKGGIGLVVKEKIKYKDENGNYKIVACKYLETKKLEKEEKRKFLLNFFRESGSMVNLFYKNIVRLISINSASCKLVMEFMEGGDLTKVIYKKKNLSLGFKIYCLFQICDGLKFLHEKQIIHGDLKSLNILLDTKYDGGENFPTLKLSDFGLSGIKEDICPGETPGFAAPELYQGSHKRTIKSDIYSFGVVIYEIFKGESPNQNRIIKDRNIYYPLPDISKEKWPNEIKELILDCCKENSEERPTIENIRNALSEYCNNSKDEKLIDVKNKALREVNFNIVNINDFACKLFEEIKLVSSKKYGEFIYKVNDKPFNGIGQYIFEDNTKYIGNFENGKINRYGIFFYSNGIKYNGEHFNGIWNGRGIFKYKNGFVEYKGKFKLFAFDEFGIISTIQQNKGKIIGKHEYFGEFSKGRQNGIGKYTDPEGREYSGEWKEGNFGGLGTFTYPDGEVCKGEFEKGIRQGFCYINYVDGSYYEGHFDKGKFDGYGKFYIKPGEFYEGEWKNGCPIQDDKLIIE